MSAQMYCVAFIIAMAHSRPQQLFTLPDMIDPAKALNPDASKMNDKCTEAFYVINMNTAALVVGAHEMHPNRNRQPTRMYGRCTS